MYRALVDRGAAIPARPRTSCSARDSLASLFPCLPAGDDDASEARRAEERSRERSRERFPERSLRRARPSAAASRATKARASLPGIEHTRRPRESSFTACTPGEHHVRRYGGHTTSVQDREFSLLTQSTEHDSWRTPGLPRARKHTTQPWPVLGFRGSYGRETGAPRVEKRCEHQC